MPTPAVENTDLPMRRVDWAASPLGPRTYWSAALQTMVAIVLASRQPMFVAWGPRRVLIHNEAYAPLLGSRHPEAFGRPFFDVWPELADEVGPLMDRVFGGEPVQMDDLPLTLLRNGYPEDTHFSFSYTPVPDGNGSVGGLFCVCAETTATVVANGRARRERDRQRLHMQQMPGFVAMLHGPDHVYDYVNDAYLRIAGDRELIGRPVRAVFPELVGQGFLELLDGVFATGTPYTARAIPIRFAGEEDARFIDLLYQPIRSETDAIEGIFVGGYDVTERVEAEAALLRSQANFRNVAEAMPGFVWTADAAGRLDYTSPHWHEYSGSDPGASVGEGWSAFVHPDDQADAFARWAEAVGLQRLYEVEFRLRRADGTHRWWLARALPSTFDGIVRWAGVCVDIDEIVAARDTLSRSQAELEALVGRRTRERDRVWRNSRDLLVVAGTDGILLAVSPAWAVVLGHDPAEVVGRSYRDFIHPDDADLTRRGLEEGARPRDLANFENRYRHKDGSLRRISWNTSVEGDVVYAYGRDVTAERAQTEAFAAMEQQLRQAQKMEAVGQLTGGIAHDFNNMLAVVIGSLDLLGRRIGDGDPRARRHVDAASDGARRAALLTQRLLAFSRQQPLRPEAVDVNRLVAGMSDLLRHSLGGAVALDTVLAAGLWATFADPNQLENVVLNLAVNARDAMPDGGRLTIETRNAFVDARHAAAGPGVAAGQYVLMEISDTGAGMPPEVVAKAFDPFFTTKEIGKGTGLGLSQVYGFVKQSNGHVDIRSVPGRGTTIRIQLPRFTAPHGEGRDAGPDVVRLRGERHELVLVVDDEPSVRGFSAEALTELGYRVLEADGAFAALRLLADHPDVALLFTDVAMPEVDGRKLAEEATRRHPRLRILFTTGHNRGEVLHDGVPDSGDALLAKPFTLDALEAKVRSVLDGDGRISG